MGNKVIRVENLVKRYGRLTAVDRISFEVEAGEIFGMVGPNGAGKTTAVECLMGLRKVDGGRVEVLGMDPHAQARPLRQRVGIQLQQSSLPEDLLVWEALDLFASFYQRSVDWGRLLQELGLEEKRSARFSALSGGQKQRLLIALSLINDPELVCLDELTTGLDPQARRAAWEILANLKQRGKTVLLVTHFMEEAEKLCDRVAIIDQGRLIALDSPHNLVQRLAGETRLRFSPDGLGDYTWLARLPGVTRVERSLDEVLVAGQGNILIPVAAALAEKGYAPADLRSEQPTLEDVFLVLTGRKMRD